MSKSAKHWIGHAIELIAIFVVWQVGSKQIERAEDALRDAQTAWFEPIGEIALVDTGYYQSTRIETHIDSAMGMIVDVDSVAFGKNLGEVIPMIKLGADPVISLQLVNRGKEAGRIVAAFAHNYEIIPQTRILWDWLLAGRLHATDVEVVSEKLIHPAETTRVSIPISIFRADSLGRTFGHIAIVASSTPHGRQALTYIWIKLNDPFRVPQGFAVFWNPIKGKWLIPDFKCNAQLIHWDSDLLETREQRAFERAQREMIRDSSIERTAQLKLMTSE